MDENIIDLALDLLSRPENVLDYTHHRRNIAKKDKVANEAIENFYNYMENLVNTKGVDYLKNFLENAIIQMGIDFGRYIVEGHSDSTNFFNLFMRQLIKENPQDVKLDTLEEKMEDLSLQSSNGNIEVSIAGVAVGHIHFEEFESNKNCVRFTEFRTLPGLERLGLGSLMISEFCRQLVIYKPGYSAVASNVAKGRDGEKTYSAWGGYPVNAGYNNETGCVILGDDPMTKEEYDLYNGSLVFYFPESVVEDLATRQNAKYPNARCEESKTIQ